MILRTIIADDEFPALRLMEDYVKRCPELVLLRKFQNGSDLSAWLEENEAEVVLLDIQMPRFTGLEVIRRMKQRPAIILTTAYSEFAVDAFSLDATDYLLKPFSFERFRQAIDKALQRQQWRELEAAAPDKKEPAYILIRADRQHVRIALEEILYIQAMAEYIRIVTLGDKAYITHESLRSMEEQLASKGFARVHKSYLVHARHVRALGSQSLQMITGEEIPIGQNYRDSARNLLS